ncbi:winged helix DNA-binding protein [Candidatus Pacearchaeota archaeon]|nr:winged helix DNA-binding protein [Candidatus Pacearchaeota archaeon]
MNKETNWEDIGFIISSEYRKKVLKNLENPKTPSSISKETNINKTHISKTLKELNSKKLIECLNPKAVKGKFFVITEEGKDILKEIGKL